jgi:hypothetical protein
VAHRIRVVEAAVGACSGITADSVGGEQAGKLVESS